MTGHIHTVAGHFAGKLYSWDVVNEVLDPGSHRPDGLRDSPWLQNCGVDYIEQAFRATAAADPHALLVWNENLSRGVERLWPGKAYSDACPARWHAGSRCSHPGDRA